MAPLALTAADVVAATGGRLVLGDARQRVERVSIDSRTVGPGDFFVAIRGERFDGHHFVASALAAGAIGALVHDPSTVQTVMGGAPAERTAAPLFVQVDDTTRALQELARDVRRRVGIPVVAITGSAGKTTTKEITAAFLSARYRVFRNKGNLNNHIGLPLSLLELRARPEIAVVELGMNHPGEIRTLVDIAEPDMRVWTNVGDAHLGFFASADAIADAKAEILEQARPADVLVANANDTRIMARVTAFRGRLVTYGVETRADIEAQSVELRGLEGTACELHTPAGTAHLDSPLLGVGNLSNVLAATAVALNFGIPLADIVERAGTLRAAPHRGELVRLPGGITLVDDSYNSSPAALKQALQVLRTATGSARRIAVLGEMLELGSHAADLHTECGREAAAAGLDLLITVGGPPARALADAAAAAGMPPPAVSYTATREQAADLAVQRVRPGDLILVKGSRGIGTDLVVDRLKAEFA